MHEDTCELKDPQIDFDQDLKNWHCPFPIAGVSVLPWLSVCYLILRSGEILCNNCDLLLDRKKIKFVCLYSSLSEVSCSPSCWFTLPLMCCPLSTGLGFACALSQTFGRQTCLPSVQEHWCVTFSRLLSTDAELLHRCSVPPKSIYGIL